MEEVVRRRQAVNLHWRRWDDSFIVFDEASGRTHQLDAVSACVLLRLEEGSRDQAALAEEVAADLGWTVDAARHALPVLFDHLTVSGLIEPVA